MVANSNTVETQNFQGENDRFIANGEDKNS